MTSTVPVPEPALCVPEGFFDEIAAQLDTEAAEEIADAVIATCISRGILHPELEQDPDDELRAQQLREVFNLLEAVTAAVADGRVVPRQLRDIDVLDPDMADVWDRFTDAALDPDAAARGSAMLDTGELVPASSTPVPTRDRK